MVFKFAAHEFPELLFAVLLPGSLSGAPALQTDEHHPGAKSDDKVWKGVRSMQSAQHGACRDEAGEDKKEESFHVF